MHGFCDEYKRKVAELQAELDKLYGPKCERSDEECPDYDTEHPYHENAIVKAHELGQQKMLGTLQDTQAALEKALQERDEAIAHDRQPYPTAWAYEQACKALENAKAQVEQLTYERDRARMMSGASGHLAEYRMYRIFDLENELKALKGEAP